MRKRVLKIDRCAGAVPSGGTGRLEKRIRELMVPESAYPRVYQDAPALRIVQVLADSLVLALRGNFTEQFRRVALVYGRDESFLGCVRLNDVLDVLAPPQRKEACAPLQRGMLVKRCHLLGDMAAGEILGEQRFVEIDAPLMEAVQLMVMDGLTDLPVLNEDKLVGVLSDRSVLLEVCSQAAGATGCGRPGASRVTWQERGRTMFGDGAADAILHLIFRGHPEAEVMVRGAQESAA
jgi:hypothetical protein